MKCQPRPPTGRSFQSESTSAGATEPGVKLRPWSRMVTRSVSSVASQRTVMVPSGRPAYPCSMMFVQASSTASLRSKQLSASAPARRQAFSTKARTVARLSTRAATSTLVSVPTRNLLGLRPPREQRLDLRQQARQLDGLRVEVVATHAPRPLGILGHGVRREADHGDAGRAVPGLDSPGRLPAVEHRQSQIHEDEIRLVGARLRDALLAVRRGRDLVAAFF